MKNILICILIFFIFFHCTSKKEVKNELSYFDPVLLDSITKYVREIKTNNCIICYFDVDRLTGINRFNFLSDSGYFSDTIGFNDILIDNRRVRFLTGLEKYFGKKNKIIHERPYAQSTEGLGFVIFDSVGTINVITGMNCLDFPISFSSCNEFWQATLKGKFLIQK